MLNEPIGLSDATSVPKEQMLVKQQPRMASVHQGLMYPIDIVEQDACTHMSWLAKLRY